VTLVHDGPDVHYADVCAVESAAEMLDAVRAAVGGESGTTRADALVSAAAISDFTVGSADEKIRSGEAITLDLEPTPKLLDSVRAEHPDLTMVGFKVETSGDEDAMVERATALRDRVDLAFVVANDASVMGGAETNALVVRPDAVDRYAGSKAGLGAEIAANLAAALD
jgi:phosphopantothenoylcysteine decarboxylase/phosphopantothenate--cysteine ligase